MIRILLALALAATVLSSTVLSAPRLILTSFQPTYSFASHVVEGSPAYRVVNIAPREQGPHEFDLEEPGNAKRVAALLPEADAVLTLRSLPVAPTFDRLYPWCRLRAVRILEIDPSVTWDWHTPKMALIPTPRDTARAAREPAPPGPAITNPHAWLSLTNAVRMVGAIADDVAGLDPAHADLYRANARRYQDELRRLKASAEAKLAGVDNLRVAALTEGFPYLTADLGIDVADYLLEPKDAAEVGRRVAAAGVKVVLDEDPPEAPVKAAIEKAGAHVVVLGTCEHGWGAGQELDPAGYEKTMRENLDALAAAFATR